MKTLRMASYILAALALTATLTSCNQKVETAPAPERLDGVRLVHATTQQVADQAESVGTVRAQESATLSAQVMGTVSRITVREGARVKAGQVLVVLSASQLEADTQRARAGVAAASEQIAAAESDAALAVSTLKRYDMLKAQKSVSPQEYDEVAARAQASSARVAALRSQQSAARAAESAAHTMQGYARIRAPFSGVVTARLADPGVVAAPGVPLLTMEKAGALQAEIPVDESLLASLKPGATLSVIVDGLGNTALPGKIAQIVPAADPASRSFLVKIALPAAEGVHSGMSARASVARGTRTAILVPASAVAARGSLHAVYAVGTDGIISLRYVTLGKTAVGQVEVLSGLSGNEALVDTPGDRELTGKRIEGGR